MFKLPEFEKFVLRYIVEYLIFIIIFWVVLAFLLTYIPYDIIEPNRNIIGNPSPKNSAMYIMSLVSLIGIILFYVDSWKKSKKIFKKVIYLCIVTIILLALSSFVLNYAYKISPVFDVLYHATRYIPMPYGAY